MKSNCSTSILYGSHMTSLFALFAILFRILGMNLWVRDLTTKGPKVVTTSIPEKNSYGEDGTRQVYIAVPKLL